MGLFMGLNGIMQVFFLTRFVPAKPLIEQVCWRQAHESGGTSWDFSCHASISDGLCFLATGYCQGKRDLFWDVFHKQYSFLWCKSLVCPCFSFNSTVGWFVFKLGEITVPKICDVCWETWWFPMDMGEKTITLWWFSIATEHKRYGNPFQKKR